jgi:hypothetical protein
MPMATLIEYNPNIIIMKPGAFLYCALFLGLVLVLAGCTSPVPGAPEVTPTEPVPTTGPGAAETASPAPTNQAIPVTPSPTALSTDDINSHFMDVAFGEGNIFLERIPFYDRKITISINGGTPPDLAAMEDFAARFNELSRSTKLFENIKDGQTGNIRIKFLPGDGLKAIDVTSEAGWLNKEFRCGDRTCAKVRDYDIYINSEMEGDMRTHYLLRSFLYVLGFNGDSMKYPDSIFYYTNQDTTRLSFLDEKAVQIMYGLGTYNGMTVDDVKKVIFFKS